MPYGNFLHVSCTYPYFADTYGLVQVPIERQGKEPGARSLAGLIDQAKQENIRVLFVQPQLDKRQVRQVARAIGGRVVAVDPLAPNYIDNLREVARQFAEAVQFRPARQTFIPIQLWRFHDAFVKAILDAVSVDAGRPGHGRAHSGRRAPA